MEKIRVVGDAFRLLNISDNQELDTSDPGYENWDKINYEISEDKGDTLHIKIPSEKILFSFYKGTGKLKFITNLA